MNEILTDPQTWLTLTIGSIVVFREFLFGKEGILFKLYESKEKREDRDIESKETLIQNLTARVNELTVKLEDALKTIHEQTLEIQKLTLRSEKNNQILDAIKKWMEDSKQSTHFLELLKSGN